MYSYVNDVENNLFGSPNQTIRLITKSWRIS